MHNLAARFEAAKGPDRGLDAEIACLVRSFPANAPSWLLNWTGTLAPAPKINSGAAAAMNDAGEITVWWNAPKFTASVDAALTLVPNGLEWEVNTLRAPHAKAAEAFIWVKEFWSTNSDEVGARCVGEAVTPALALCAAALKAHAALRARVG